jgi:hypothetical protein
MILDRLALLTRARSGRNAIQLTENHRRAIGVQFFAICWPPALLPWFSEGWASRVWKQKKVGIKAPVGKYLMHGYYDNISYKLVVLANFFFQCRVSL